MKIYGIFGTGGMARETADIALDLGHRPILIARDQEAIRDWDYPYDVVMEENTTAREAMCVRSAQAITLLEFGTAHGSFKHLEFVNLIHPSATFGKAQKERVEIRRDNIICAGVRFTNNIAIGTFNILNLNSTLAMMFLSKIL